MHKLKRLVVAAVIVGVVGVAIGSIIIFYHITMLLEP